MLYAPCPLIIESRVRLDEGRPVGANKVNGLNIISEDGVRVDKLCQFVDN